MQLLRDSDESSRLESGAFPHFAISDYSIHYRTPRVSSFFRDLPVLELEAGYWERAATNRAKLLKRRLRARLADTLIAQSCIDRRVPLITRDSDFRHFARHAGLELV